MTLDDTALRLESIDAVAGYWLAVSPMFTVTHVDVLSEAGVWGVEQQSSLSDARLFDAAGGESGARRLHSEVRAELAERFVDPFAVDPRARAIHQTLAVRLADHGGEAEVVGAMFHARRGEAWHVLVELWGRHGLGLIARGDTVTFDAYSRLPNSVLEAYPYLVTAAVVFDQSVQEADGPDRRAVIAAASTRAASLLSSDLSESSADVAVNVMVGAMIHERTQGRFDIAAHVAERIEVEIDRRVRAAEGVRPALEAWAGVQCGLTFLLVSQVDRARLTTTAAHRSARLAGIDGEHVVVNAAAQLALIEAVGGSPAEAARWIADAAGRPCHPWFDLPVRAPAVAAGALLDAERLSVSSNGVSLDALALADLEIWPFVQVALARRRIRRGEPAVALAELDAAVSRHGRAAGPQMPLVLAVARSEALVALGDDVQALQTIARAAHGAGVEASSQLLLSLPFARAQRSRGRRAREGQATILTRPEGYPLVDRVEAQLLAMRSAVLSGDREGAERIGREVEGVIVRHRLWWLAAIAPLPLEAVERVDEARAAVATAVPYPTPSSPATLSERERVVLAQLVASGSIDEIARALVVSPNTVKSQLRSIYRKLGVSSREAALAEARRLGLDRT